MDLKKEKEPITNSNDRLFQKILHLTCATNGLYDASLRLIDSGYLTKQERTIIDYMMNLKKTTGSYPRYRDVCTHFNCKADIDLESPVIYECEKESENKGKTKSEYNNGSDAYKFDDFVSEFLWNKKKLLIIDKIEKFLPKFINGTFSEEFIRDLYQLLYDAYPYAIPDTVKELEKRFKDTSLGLSSSINEINHITGGFKRKQLITIAGDKNSYSLYAMNLLKDVVINKLNVCFVSFNTSSDIVLCKLLSSLSELLIGKKINYTNILCGSKLNSDTFKKILEAFEDKYSKNICFVDDKNFETFDLDWLSKILFSANNSFCATTNRPIDVIFVEGLENARLEKDFQAISSSNVIANTYINYLKHYAQEHNIAIIVFTSQNGKQFKSIAYQNGFTDFTDTISHIDVMSDIFILCKYFKMENIDKKKEKFMCQLVKSPLGIAQDEPSIIDIEKKEKLILENIN